MPLSREQLLILVLASSPFQRDGKPTVFGSTRMQKLIFLALREYESIRSLCPDPYQFVPYDFGPYSADLDRDLRKRLDEGRIDQWEAKLLATDPQDLPFEYLTSLMDKRPRVADRFILKGPDVEEAARLLKQLESEGLDSARILQDFRDLHARYGTISLENLLRYVYKEYPALATATKRPDLLDHPDQGEWEDEGEEAEEYDP